MSATTVSRRRSLHASPRSSRTKHAISYAEPSSDSDLDSDSDELGESSSRSTARSRVQPRRSSRRAGAHQSDDTEEDEEDELLDTEPVQPRPSRQSTRKVPIRGGKKSNTLPGKRARPQTRTYHSDESDDELPKKRRKTTRPPTPKSPKSLANSFTTHNIIESRIIPQWQSLPYHILLQVFKYAAYPLYDVCTFQPSPSATWLLKMARLCRQFTEPALTALYSSPPLVPMVQAHRLVDILRSDPRQMAFGYRQKIQSLHIDVGQVVAYSLTGSGHLDLRDLIKDLPRLADLELYHQKDMAPYRELNDNIKWTYPESLFDALEYVDPAADPMRGDKTSVCRLRSWRWSRRLAGSMWDIEKMHEVHLKPSFSALRKIGFVDYQIPDGQGVHPRQTLLADSLKPLKNLQHLVFEASTICDEDLLPLLPKNLRHLEFINCAGLEAEHIASFLLTHGSQLRTLVLNHNQRLSLGFLPVLGIACPHLQVFKMNLSYYNGSTAYRDSEPLYAQLLFPDQIPVWPSTLQIIELTNMRKWETDAAEMFFQSLLDSAANLPDLRKLALQCIISVGWRDRASFREKWIGSLDRIFKRVSEPPRHIVSIRSEPEAETGPIAHPKVETAIPIRDRTPPHISDGGSSSTEATPPSPARRSQRTATQPGLYAESPDNSDAEPEAEYQLPNESFRKSRPNGLARELAILKQTAGIDSPPDNPSSPAAASSDDDEPIITKIKGKGKTREAIQGMCEVVEVRIDNLRPTEVQVTEADFLDEEASGDEDWNGEDVVVDGYAW
ncbi:hypothetical protein LOCC1_G006552 [Lachnellula occidentalis]|uniref:Uncharacterized protein n=1 Tax=Lachnellula occidentalis TaxID=215460 RepID=A0A8H8S1Z0_9HELO|nr:hypothetical protein LOCC1_G006552 [Lachnellula occidentalis]